MSISHLREQTRPRGWAGEFLAPLIFKRNHLIDSGSTVSFSDKKPPQCKSAPYDPFSHLDSSDLKHPKNSERFFIFRHYVLWCNTYLKAATANLSLFVPIHQVVCIQQIAALKFLAQESSLTYLFDGKGLYVFQIKSYAFLCPKGTLFGITITADLKTAAEVTSNMTVSHKY